MITQTIKGDYMNKIHCYANKCIYSSNENCTKYSIKVKANRIDNEIDTICESFRNRKSTTFFSEFASEYIKNDFTKIKCGVYECSNNIQSSCNLKNIIITYAFNDGEIREHTFCESFSIKK